MKTPINLLGRDVSTRMRVAALNCESYGAAETAVVLREDADAVAELVAALSAERAMLRAEVRPSIDIENAAEARTDAALARLGE